MTSFWLDQVVLWEGRTAAGPEVLEVGTSGSPFPKPASLHPSLILVLPMQKVVPWPGASANLSTKAALSH